MKCGMIPRPMASSAEDAKLDGVEVNLERSPTDPERAAFAQLSVYGSGDKSDELEVAINAVSQFHSDKGWPNLQNVPIDATCLVTPGAPPLGQNTSSAFPRGIAEGLSLGQPLNEKGEPDGSAR